MNRFEKGDVVTVDLTKTTSKFPMYSENEIKVEIVREYPTDVGYKYPYKVTPHGLYARRVSDTYSQHIKEEWIITELRCDDCNSIEVYSTKKESWFCPWCKEE